MSKVVELSARRQPVNYTVRITHHWDDRLEVFVEDVADDDRSRASVSDALQRASRLFDIASEREATAEEGRLLRGISSALDCLNPESENASERLAWLRLYDAEMGREPRGAEQLGCEPRIDAEHEGTATHPPSLLDAYTALANLVIGAGDGAVPELTRCIHGAVEAWLTERNIKDARTLAISRMQP